MKMTAKDVKEITYMPLVTFCSAVERLGKNRKGVATIPLVRRGLTILLGVVFLVGDLTIALSLTVVVSGVVSVNNIAVVVSVIYGVSVGEEFSVVILLVDVLVFVDSVLVGGILVAPAVRCVVTVVVVGEVVCTFVLLTSEVVDSPVVAGIAVDEANVVL